MLKKFLILTIPFILFIIIISVFGLENVYAQTTPSPTTTLITAPPPQLRDLEFAFVRFIYIAWAFGGIVFMLLLVYIGFLFLSGGTEPNNIEIAKKRAGMWVVGLLLYFLAWPIANTFMSGLITNDPGCYENLNTPGFTFFFPNVCTSPPLKPAPTPTTMPAQGTPGTTTGTSEPGTPASGTTTTGTSEPGTTATGTICEQILNESENNSTCYNNCRDQNGCTFLGDANARVCSSIITYENTNYTIDCYCDDDSGVFEDYIVVYDLWPFEIKYSGGECANFFPYEPFF